MNTVNQASLTQAQKRLITAAKRCHVDDQTITKEAFESLVGVKSGEGPTVSYGNIEAAQKTLQAFDAQKGHTSNIHNLPERKNLVSLIRSISERFSEQGQDAEIYGSSGRRPFDNLIAGIVIMLVAVLFGAFSRRD